MSLRQRLVRDGGLYLSADLMMGAAGCCLALASTSFGIFMTMRGPSPDFGKGSEFTVFAQLAPRPSSRGTTFAQRDTGPPSRNARPASTASDDLDTTSTASIPRRPPTSSVDPADEARANAVVAAAVVELATDDAATIAIDGHVRTVHVGDTLPDAGDILAINPGAKPSVKTTRGMIFSSRGE